MKISTKFILSISAILIGYLATTGINFYLGALNEKRLAFNAEQLFPAVIKAQNAKAVFDRQKKAYESYFLYGESDYLDSARHLRAQVQTYLKAIVAQKKIAASHKAQVNKFLDRHARWSRQSDRLFASLFSGDLFSLTAAQKGHMAELARTQTALTAQLGRISDSLTETLIGRNTTIIRETRFQRYSGLALLVVVALISSVAIFFVLKRIVGPIQALARISHDIASGDLSQRAEIYNQDETGELAQAFNTMTQQLQMTLEKIQAEVKEKEKAEQEVRLINEELEERVRARTRELEEAQKELLENAHRAGMADIAAGTLHNIGNILTSVQVSAEIINETLLHTPLPDMRRAGQIIRENENDLTGFLHNDAKAAKLLLYYLKLEERFVKTQAVLQKNSRRLEDKIQAINDVIAAQQNYAGSIAFHEKLDIREIIDDALTMQAGTLEKHNITVLRDYQAIPPIFIEKSKFLHVLVNLFKNAKEAMEDQTNNKFLSVSVVDEDETITVRICDTGQGIAPGNINQIFTHGFTTKATGHGFGLHSCGNYLAEMKGTISVSSDGPQKGAVFTLVLPKATEAPAV